MALTLQQLIKISPVDEEIKQRFLREENNLTEDDKFEIAQICWKTLSLVIEARRQQKFDQMLKETAEGGIEYQPEDFTREEDAIISEFLIKIDQTQTTEDLQQVKEELKKYLPPVQQVPSTGDPTKAVH